MLISLRNVADTDRHCKSQRHIKNDNIKLKEHNDLRAWVANNNIFYYDKLTDNELKEFESSLNSKKK